MSQLCPFCRMDPFHRVDNGLGMEAVAVTCCDHGAELYSENCRPEILAFASRIQECENTKEFMDRIISEVELELNDFEEAQTEAQS